LADTTIGYIHFLGGGGVRRNSKKAALYFDKAAKKKDMSAMVALGELYEKGDGVRKDPETAWLLWREAGSRGSGNALYFLGQRFAVGRPKSKELEQCYVWNVMARERGSQRAPETLRRLTPYLTPEQISAAEATATKNLESIPLANQYGPGLLTPQELDARIETQLKALERRASK
jgi:TPR repeat protein